MNKNMDKEFDQKLKNKLENYRPTVPPMLWDKIQEELDNRTETIVLGTPTVKRTNWFKYSAAAAVVIMFGAFLYFNNRPQEVLYLTNNVEISANEVESFATVEESQEVSQPSFADDVRSIRQVFANAITKKAEAQPVLDEDINALQFAVQTDTPPLHTGEQVSQSELVGAHAEFEKLNQSAMVAGVEVDTKNEVQNPNNFAQVEEYHVSELESDDDQGGDRAEENQTRSRFGISKLLNLMVAQIDKRDERFISFSNDEEGSLKVDFKLAQAKNNKNNK